MSELSLPQETSWKLLAVSPDMMDTQFCNKKFPFRWRSSLAISAFEPDPATLPSHLCEGRLTFLKVTATITGYQPSERETKTGFASFPNVPTEELSRIIGQYFACYGVLLTVAVFPPKRDPIPLPPDPVPLADFPHIIDFEPKSRDLVQASTETGEILTTSKSNIKTNKSFTHTESSETGFELTGGVGGGGGGGKKEGGEGGGGGGGGGGGPSAAAKLSHKNTESEQENWSVATDASRERQEKEGSSTQISQLYNLLSAYHVGTNRAQFLMLPRPHTLPPTDHRTFVNGLREIEGIQEFILIVARPPGMTGLSIEASLETGHFPEGLTVQEPAQVFDERHEDFKVTAFADNGTFGGEEKNIDTVYEVQGGFVVDVRPERGSDPGHDGMKELQDQSNDHARNSLKAYNYRRLTDGSVTVVGKIKGPTGPFRDGATFNRDYRVFTRSIEPKVVSGGAHVPLDRLLVTRRHLCVTFASKEDCPVVVNTDIVAPPSDEVIGLVAEIPISLRGGLVPRGGESTTAAAKALLSELRTAMTTSWRMPQRRTEEDAPGFLESDYFKDRIKRFVPRDRLDEPVPGLAKGGKKRESKERPLTVGEALDLDLFQFAEAAGLTIAEAVQARREMLGIRESEAAA